MAALDIGVYGARGIPSTYSGYETFLTELLPALGVRGHSVTMYCRRGEVPSAPSYRGVRLVHLPAIQGKNFSTLSHGYVAAVAARLGRHDVVLGVNVAKVIACAIGAWTGQPVVLNTDGQEWLRGKWGRVGRSVFKTSARVAPATATALISDCDAMAQIYRDEFGALGSTVIPYMYLQSACPDVSLVESEFGLLDRDFFLAGGRLVPENNVDRIAEAYVRTDATLPLVILGAANYDSPTVLSLERLARTDSRIRLLGHIS